MYGTNLSNYSYITTYPFPNFRYGRTGGTKIQRMIRTNIKNIRHGSTKINHSIQQIFRYFNHGWTLPEHAQIGWGQFVNLSGRQEMDVVSMHIPARVATLGREPKDDIGVQRNMRFLKNWVE